MAMMGYILAGLGGLAVGSLLNVVITRLSQDEPLFSGAFQCQHCHHPLPRHLFLPLLGYAWARGRCRNCGAPLLWRYPAVELAAGLLGLALWWRFPGSPLLVVYGPFFAALLVLSVLDLQYYWLPDLITLPGITLGLAAALVFPQLNFRYALLGASLSYAFFRLVGWTYEKMSRGKRFGLGRGDAKLLAFIGAVLGLQALPWSCSAARSWAAWRAWWWPGAAWRAVARLFPMDPSWRWGLCCSFVSKIETADITSCLEKFKVQI